MTSANYGPHQHNMSVRNAIRCNIPPSTVHE